MKRVSFRLSKIFVKLFRTVVFSAFMLSTVLLFSCKGVDNVSVETETERTTATTDSSTVAQKYVTLSVAAEFPVYARTVNPTDIDFSTDMALSFTLCGKWKGEGDEETDVTFEKSWSSSSAGGEQKTAYEIMSADSFEILIGTWDFTLSAFKNGKEMYYQTIENKTLSVPANGNNTISLDFGVMDEAEEGNGSVTVTLDFPADKGITSVKAALIKLDGTELSGFSYEALEITDSEASANTKTVTYTKATVPCGTYRIKFALYDSNNFVAKTARDIIHVAPCNESVGNLTVTQINTLYKITYAGLSEAYNCVTGYTVQNDYELVENYNASQTIVLPGTQLKKGPYYAAAWYETEDLSGEPITGWEIGDRAEDVTVYPKWYTTGSEAAAAISALNVAGDYTICIKGNISSSNFTNMNTAFKGISSTLEVGVTLDLSEATMATIPASAFNGCTKLKEIIIPACVTSIENYAFNGCTGLKTVRLKDGAATLKLGCNTYSSAGKGLFADCPLTSLYVGRKISYTTYGNTGSGYSSYSDKPSYYGYSAFANITTSLEAEIGANVTSISMYMFYGCTGLKNVTIAESAQIASIGTSAFYNCVALTALTITSMVTTIGDGAFSGCKVLASITIPSSVTSIGNSVFNGCTGLKTVMLEDGAATLKLGCNTYSKSDGKGLFADCPLTSLYVGRKISYTTYGSTGSGYSSYSDKPAYYGYSAFANITTSFDVELGENVISIPMYIFYGCTGLKSITIAESAQIASIGTSAFYNCEALTALTIPSMVTTIGDGAFSGCKVLASITIPSSVTSIGNSVFNGCTGLTSLTLIDGTVILNLGCNTYSKSDGKGLFADCPLTSLYVGRKISYTTYGSTSSGYSSYSDKPAYYGYSAFANITTILDAEIGANVTSIPVYMFYGCTGLKSVIINSSASISFIGSNSFNGCSSFTTLKISSDITTDSKVKIPTSVTSIGTNAFQNCTSMQSIIIPGNVTSIGNSAFNGCSGLKILRLEDGETLTIGCNEYGTSGGKGLFADCKLTNLYVGRNISYTSYGSGYSTYSDKPENYGYSAFSGITTSFDAEIGANVTSIPMYMFYGCTGLKSVTIAESAQITSIKKSAFYKCEALTVLTIPSMVTSIWESAFEGCKGLTSITIPASVTSIGKYAFNGCTGLTSLTLMSGTEVLMLGCNTYDPAGGKGLFADCKLTSLNLGRNISYTTYGSGYSSYSDKPSNYGYSAFANITSLATVTITVPSGVTVFTIGKYAFKGCTGITSATFKPTTIWKNSTSSSSGGTEVVVNTEASAAKVLKEMGENYLYWKKQ